MDGILYLSYRAKNTDDNSTFKIKHLNGSIWTDDLNWTADNIMELKIAKGTGGIYFISNTQAFSQYKGGVYKVTSTTTVDALISENDTWFYTPFDITVDINGNVIISSMRYVSESLFYPNLSLYDGSSWNTISGDFTGGIEPVSVHADGSTLYYVYGDKNNVTTWGDTKALKSIKLTK